MGMIKEICIDGILNIHTPVLGSLYFGIFDYRISVLRIGIIRPPLQDPHIRLVFILQIRLPSYQYLNIQSTANDQTHNM